MEQCPNRQLSLHSASEEYGTVSRQMGCIGVEVGVVVVDVVVVAGLVRVTDEMTIADVVSVSVPGEIVVFDRWNC